MQPGPKPTPNRLHLVHGNPSKKPAAELLDEVRPPVEVPDCPSHLLADAKKEWKRIAPLLLDLGLVASIDMAALAVYCQAYGRWKQAEKMIAAKNRKDPHHRAGLVGTTPSGYEQISVELQISNRAVEQMYKFLCEFGMTPSARSRVTPSDVQPFLPGFGPSTNGGSGSAPPARGFQAL